MHRDGFTLLEVLLALLIVTVGVLALAGALGPIIRLAAEGREQSRIALGLESRIEWLRAQAWRGKPCQPPAPGTARRPDGVVESWRATARDGSIELLVAGWVEGRRRPPDTVLTRLPCP